MPLYDKVLLPVNEIPLDSETAGRFTLEFDVLHRRRLPINLGGAEDNVRTQTS